MVVRAMKAFFYNSILKWNTSDMTYETLTVDDGLADNTVLSGTATTAVEKLFPRGSLLPA